MNKTFVQFLNKVFKIPLQIREIEIQPENMSFVRIYNATFPRKNKIISQTNGSHTH